MKKYLARGIILFFPLSMIGGIVWLTVDTVGWKLACEGVAAISILLVIGGAIFTWAIEHAD